MSSISAGTTSGTALVSTADTTGALVLKTNGTTTALTLGADQTATFVGAVTAPSFSGTSSTATNLAGGSAGTVPYQSASNTTQMLAAGSSGQSLLSSGASAPTWGTPALATAATTATTSTNLAGGSNGTIPYQSAMGTTQMLAVGTAGQLLQTNGAGAPTWVTPAPGAGTVTAVATGSLSTGATVVVNSDGTVSVVAQTILTTPVFGADVVVGSTNNGIESIAATYDSVNNRVVVFYTDGFTTYPTALVGAVVGTTINFGTAVVASSQATSGVAVTFDTANAKVVFMCTRSGTTPIAGVGTVSGTTISFGTIVAFDSVAAYVPNIVYDSLNGKVVCAYQSASPGVAIVGTVSGTSISFGTKVEFDSGDTTVISMTFDTGSNKVVIAYKDDDNNQYGTAIVGTVSGTSISFGTPVVFQASYSTNFISICYSTAANKVVIAYRNGTTSHGTAIVGTVSGTSISFGTAAVFRANQIAQTKIAYDQSADRVLITYLDVNVSNASTAIIGVVSGTSISFGTSTTFAVANSYPVSLAYDGGTEAILMAYKLASSFGRAEMAVLSTTNMTLGNFIGFSQAAYTNGQTATIQTVGSVDSNQTSLTPGNSYYVRKNGTLGLVPTSPSVFAGTSLASTKVIIKG